MIDSYCKEKGIELIINQNSFGHMERFLKHKRYLPLAENPDGYIDPWGVFRDVDTTVSPVQEGVLPFFTDLYTQLTQVITSDYIHIGGDEPWGFGNGRSKKACEEKGLEFVYLDYIKSLHSILTSLGKKTMIWADVVLKYPHIIPLIPKDIVICQWEYEANVPIEHGCKALYEADKEFYVGCGTSDWNCLSGRWQNAYTHIVSGIENAHTYHAKGFLITQWGDNGHMQQLPLMIPPIILAGLLSWNKELIDELNMNFLITTSLEMVPKLVSYRDTFHTKVYRTLSSILFEIEKVGEFYEEHIHNNTLLGAILLFHQVPYYRECVFQARGYTFEREKRLLVRLLNRLTNEMPLVNCQMKDELLFTIQLLSFLAEYGKELLATQHIMIEEIPKERKKRFATEIAMLIPLYSQLWLATSRQGGLIDSVSRLHSLHELLKGQK